MRPARACLAACAVLLALSGCGGFQLTCPVLPVLPQAAPAAADAVEVRFLGVGGFLIRYGSGGQWDTVLTAPLYSNPTFGEIATQPVNPDGRLIDALLPQEADEARAIFVGHGHYDHLMDVPWVATRRARQAVIYGNDAVYDVLQTSPDVKARVKSLEPLANQACHWTGNCRAGTPPWTPYRVPGMRLRVWSILSEHSPQFVLPGPLAWLFPNPVHLWRGTPFEPPTRLPTRPGDWPEGTVLAYVFDFLTVDSSAADTLWDSPQVAFRVYYQDSSARLPFGYPPEVYREHPPGLAPRVDLALLCVGGSEEIPGSAGEIVRRLAPRFIMGQHWEDFFNPRQLQVPRPPKRAREPAYETYRGLIAGADPKGFEKRLRAALPKDAEYVMACPDAITRFTRTNGSWGIALSSERWRR